MAVDTWVLFGIAIKSFQNASLLVSLKGGEITYLDVRTRAVIP